MYIFKNLLGTHQHVGVRHIACGSGHTVVLSNAGEIYSVGRGDDGRLGHGDNGWKCTFAFVCFLFGLFFVSYLVDNEGRELEKGFCFLLSLTQRYHPTICALCFSFPLMRNCILFSARALY
jgi:Regulator of chromosome condensation (RCC1) repeat